MSPVKHIKELFVTPKIGGINDIKLMRRKNSSFAPQK